MNLIKTLKNLYHAEHPHFLSIDKKTYDKWSFLIKMAVGMNKRYKSCEIFRKKYKLLENFVVIGLKYNGKNVKRRTKGFAKEFLQENKNCRCIYCNTKLSSDNITSDHILPISEGGNNCKVNLVVCCKNCNNERGNIPFNDYLKIKRKLDGKNLFI